MNASELYSRVVAFVGVWVLLGGAPQVASATIAEPVDVGHILTALCERGGEADGLISAARTLSPGDQSVLAVSLLGRMQQTRGADRCPNAGEGLRLVGKLEQPSNSVAAALVEYLNKLRVARTDARRKGYRFLGLSVLGGMLSAHDERGAPRLSGAVVGHALDLIGQGLELRFPLDAADYAGLRGLLGALRDRPPVDHAERLVPALVGIVANSSAGTEPGFIDVRIAAADALGRFGRAGQEALVAQDLNDTLGTALRRGHLYTPLTVKTALLRAVDALYFDGKANAPMTGELTPLARAAVHAIWQAQTDGYLRQDAQLDEGLKSTAQVMAVMAAQFAHEAGSTADTARSQSRLIAVVLDTGIPEHTRKEVRQLLDAAELTPAGVDAVLGGLSARTVDAQLYALMRGLPDDRVPQLAAIAVAEAEQAKGERAAAGLLALGWRARAEIPALAGKASELGRAASSQSELPPFVATVAQLVAFAVDPDPSGRVARFVELGLSRNWGHREAMLIAARFQGVSGDSELPGKRPENPQAKAARALVQRGRGERAQLDWPSLIPDPSATNVITPLAMAAAGDVATLRPILVELAAGEGDGADLLRSRLSAAPAAEHAMPGQQERTQPTEREAVGSERTPPVEDGDSDDTPWYLDPIGAFMGLKLTQQIGVSIVSFLVFGLLGLSFPSRMHAADSFLLAHFSAPPPLLKLGYRDLRRADWLCHIVLGRGVLRHVARIWQRGARTASWMDDHPSAATEFVLNDDGHPRVLDAAYRRKLLEDTRSGLALRGLAGSGKTALAAWLARGAVNDGRRPLVPVWFEVAACLDASVAPEVWLVAAVKRALGWQLPESMAPDDDLVVREMLRAGHLLVIFDAVDPVAEQFETALHGLVKSGAVRRYVVISRGRVGRRAHCHETIKLGPLLHGQWKAAASMLPQGDSALRLARGLLDELGGSQARLPAVLLRLALGAVDDSGTLRLVNDRVSFTGDLAARPQAVMRRYLDWVLAPLPDSGRLEVERRVLGAVATHFNPPASDTQALFEPLAQELWAQVGHCRCLESLGLRTDKDGRIKVADAHLAKLLLDTLDDRHSRRPSQTA